MSHMPISYDAVILGRLTRFGVQYFRVRSAVFCAATATKLMDRKPAACLSPEASWSLDPALLDENGTPVPFIEGQVLACQGDTSPGLYVIVRGQVLLSRARPDRPAQALYLLGPGDVFGEGGLQPSRQFYLSARAVTPGHAVVLSTALLRSLAQREPAQILSLLALLSQRLELSHRRQDWFSVSSPRERLLHVLAHWARRFGRTEGDDLWLPLGLTHSELADVAGLARETVSRTLTTLETEGLIERRARQGMWLKPAALWLHSAAIVGLPASRDAVPALQTGVVIG